MVHTVSTLWATLWTTLWTCECGHRLYHSVVHRVDTVCTTVWLTESDTVCTTVCTTVWKSVPIYRSRWLCEHSVFHTVVTMCFTLWRLCVLSGRATPNKNANYYPHSNSLLPEISWQEQTVAGANVGSPLMSVHCVLTVTASLKNILWLRWMTVVK